MSKGKRQAASGGWHRGGDPFEEDHKKQKKKRGKMGDGKRTALIVLGCIAVLAAAVGAAWMIFVKPPDVTDNDRPGVADGPAAPGTTAPSQGDKDKPDEPLSGRKKDYYTFLLLGKDTSSGSTDTIILVSYDVPNQQVNMMSIPRDTAVNVPWTVKKINSVYSAKESSGGGLENLKKQVGYLTGVMPDRYVIVEWEAVGEIVEAVGGVVSPIRGITTRTTTGGAPDTAWRELTTILVVDDVIPAIRQSLRSRFSRMKNTAQTRGAIRSQVIVELESKLRAEIIESYGDVLVSVYEEDPAMCLVEFSFAVTHGLNQIYLTAHITI